jgi:DNA-directed RNA polymerase subunit beta'
MGRVSSQAVVGSDGQEIFPRNHMFVEDDVQILKDKNVDQIKVRTVLTCRERYGFCAACFGRDLARGKMVSIGETVGIIAAQSIGEPGTQLTMRTFHVGGTATAGARVNKTEIRTSGIVAFDKVQIAKMNDGQMVIMNKTGEIIIKNEQGVEKERYPAVYGARIFFKEGQQVTVGDRVMEWDPFAIPIITEVSGTVKYEDLVVGNTVNEQIDAVTGLTHKVVVESKDVALQPRVVIVDDAGKLLTVAGTKRQAVYRIPVGANITISDGARVEAGSPIAKVQRETMKTKDITGGLPRVAELFEARKPAHSAQIADVSGIVEFGSELRGTRRIIIRPEDGTEPVVYSVPKGRYVIVNEGDFIRAGDPIMDGPSNPHDILRVLGLKHLARYIVDEIQEVYRLQGVRIDDKHIEVIVSQMVKKVEIQDPGDSCFIAGDTVTKLEFLDENVKLSEQGLKLATANSLLLGITKASLTTESFLSAASFQETTKVLTQAALEGKSDALRGLKENVIMGRLIPAGTGISRYREFEAEVVQDEKEPTEEVVLTV